MLQGWHDLTSIHWRFDPAVVQALLPEPFRVDTFDGAAWVGVIPFSMERIRVPHTPALGLLSSFPETNVRTYVVDPAGRRGVWFFSLDITRLLPALVARVSYHLPYCWSTMTVARIGDLAQYTSRRHWPKPATDAGATTKVIVRVGEPIEPADVTDLEHFLTARWALGSTWARRPIWAEVEHGTWPLHRAELLACDESLVTAAGLPAPSGPAEVLWSPGVEVRIARPRRVRASRR